MAEAQDDYIREEAARALARLGTPEAYARLRPMVFDSSERVRWAAITALDTSGLPDAEAILQEVLEKEPSEWIRHHVKSSLNRLRLEREAKERLETFYATANNSRGVTPTAKPDLPASQPPAQAPAASPEGAAPASGR